MSPRESNPEQPSLRLKGPEAIAGAVEAARHFAESRRLAEEDLARLCVVVEELVANLYDHGGLTDRDEVVLGLAADERGVRVSIQDRGSPFNPWTSPAATQTRRGGGAGVRIVQAWAELIDYRSSEAGNRLELLVLMA